MRWKRPVPSDFVDKSRKLSTKQLCKFYRTRNETIKRWRSEKGIEKQYYPPRPVAQYDEFGLLICTYSNATEAARLTYGSASSIRLCCKGKGKTSGGYHWKYV